MKNEKTMLIVGLTTNSLCVNLETERG